MRLFLIIVLLASLSGCVTKGVSEDAINAKKTELANLTKSRIVSVVEEPYMGARAIKLPKNAEFSSGVFSKSITLNKRGSISDLCSSISSMTGLPITVQGGGSGYSSSPSPVPSGGSLDGDLKAALGDVGQEPSIKPSSSPIRSGSSGHRINYTGTVKGLLDIIASKSGLSWGYTPELGVSFSPANIKTFTLIAAPGKVIFSNKITNESKDSSSTSGGGSSSQDSSMQTAQVNSTELNFDIWKDVETEVKGLLTSTGTVTINQAAGTITVKDSPQSLLQIGKYVADLNERLSRQIALSIKVWSLEINDSGEAGLDLSVFFENPDVRVFSGASPLALAGAGGEISSAIVNGKLKGSTAVLKGLRTLGKATQVTSGGGVVLSNQPVPVQAIKREAYLASSSQTISDNGNTTELVPGEVTTGFAMTVIPHILENRQVVLQYTVNLSNLDDLAEFSAGDSSVQLPKVSTRSFAQRMKLKMGQTLVLAGFEQEIDGKTTSGGILGIGRSRDYAKSLIVITISTENGDI